MTSVVNLSHFSSFIYFQLFTIGKSISDTVKQQTHQLRIIIRANVCKIASHRPGHTRMRFVCFFIAKLFMTLNDVNQLRKESHFFWESKPPEALPLRSFLLRFLIAFGVSVTTCFSYWLCFCESHLFGINIFA